MNRLTAILLCLMFSLFIVGCKNINIGTKSPEDVSDSFDGNVSVKVEDKVYECELCHTPEHATVIKIIKPEALCGLTLSWVDGKYSISWKNLSCELGKEFLAERSFARAIADVFNSLSEKEKLSYISSDAGEAMFSGSCGSGEYNLLVDKKGTVSHISIPSKGIEADFT